MLSYSAFPSPDSSAVGRRDGGGTTVSGCSAASILDVAAGKRRKPCWKSDINRQLYRRSTMHAVPRPHHIPKDIDHGGFKIQLFMWNQRIPRVPRQMDTSTEWSIIYWREIRNRCDEASTRDSERVCCWASTSGNFEIYPFHSGSWSHRVVQSNKCAS